jgi:hypothetical protein
MALPAEEAPPRRGALVLNPRSGNGKVVRCRLVEVAEILGARVLLAGPRQDAAALARRALEDGAEVLGVAGGDGTASTVAAVAAEADRPLVVVPAYAQPLRPGPRARHPRPRGRRARATGRRAGPGRPGIRGGEALRQQRVVRRVRRRPAQPRYREAKARALASVAGPYLEGRQWVDAGVDTPEGTIDRPQVVLVSNNPYHIATPRYLGGASRSTAGCSLRSSSSAPPARPPSRSRAWCATSRSGVRHDGAAATPGGEGVITWSVKPDHPARHGADRERRGGRRGGDPPPPADVRDPAASPVACCCRQTGRGPAGPALAPTASPPRSGAGRRVAARPRGPSSRALRVAPAKQHVCTRPAGNGSQ